MHVPLVVLVGAGASRGAGDLDQPPPPLTTELFASDYGSVLDLYPLAAKAGRHIREQIQASPTPPVFESLLRGLRESDYAHHRHMALAVPFYLQELLWEQSQRQHLHATAYERLTRKLLELPSVFFVTLNYDVLLDRELHSYRTLNTLDAYIAPRSNWALLKPHGSVNWWWPLQSPTSPYTPSADTIVNRDQVGVVVPDANWWDARGLNYADAIEPQRRFSQVGRYPALALPEGPDDTIVMPRDHTQFLIDNISGREEIDLLVIGYSGYDRAILELLGHACAGRTRIRRITVVNFDQEAAAEVYGRFKQAGLEAVWQDIRPEKFADWSGGRLDYLVANYGGGPGYDAIDA